jgi:hypothetical protein
MGDKVDEVRLDLDLAEKVEKPVEVKISMPAAGPHAIPSLTNYDATPGCGCLPSNPETGDECDPGVG